jgi:hypothetical protein
MNLTYHYNFIPADFGTNAQQDSVQFMAVRQPDLPLQFVHMPNLRTAHLIESYCGVCGLFVAASTRLELIRAAEKAHMCAPSATPNTRER